MEHLDLNDLSFNVLNYKGKGAGLRKWLLTSLEFYPASFSSISKETKISYRTLLRFVSGKSKYMSYRNMIALNIYVQSLMREDNSLKLEGIKDEDFFIDG